MAQAGESNSDDAPPWLGLMVSHGLTIDVDGASVLIGDVDHADPNDSSWLVFDEAMDFAELLHRAIARATWNAVNDRES